jgi:hypothetical protein
MHNRSLAESIPRVIDIALGPEYICADLIDAWTFGTGDGVLG